MNWILKTYDYFTYHRRICVGILAAVTVAIVALVSRLDYKEDISDFLPLGSKEVKALSAYQHFAGASRMFAVFSSSATDEDRRLDDICMAIDDFAEQLSDVELVYQMDVSAASDMVSALYGNIGLYLQDKDYDRIESLLSQENYIEEQLRENKQLLLFPSGGMLTENIGKDPLNLFAPVLNRLQASSSQINYETFNGYIFSPDMDRAIVVVTSPYGSSESEKNKALLDRLHRVGEEITETHVGVSVDYLGAPIIAVGNANQIKHDSVLAVTIAMVLILALLFYVFKRGSVLLMISLSVAWGWLFALAGLSIVHDNVSIIVIGISSVIIGIAVNYPLHLIAHLSHTNDRRSAIREIVSPLLVGNITTVGAFLALVPLQSIALRDLGIFAALLLIGTIIFVLLFLPHLTHAKQTKEAVILSRLSNLRIENNGWFMLAVAVLTVVFAYFSLRTEFDSNMGHINYMTEKQKEDMAYLNSLIHTTENTAQLFVMSTGATVDEALMKSEDAQVVIDSLKNAGLVHSLSTCTNFVCSESTRQKRLARWQCFVNERGDSIVQELRTAAVREGFNEHSFDEFVESLSPDHSKEEDTSSPKELTTFANYIFVDNTATVIDQLVVDVDNIDHVKDILQAKSIDSFDLLAINSSVANQLSNNFNYIGWACGLIVFLFLWLSLGSIELAIISFVPMAVSWLWILGLMSLIGIQFNVVNIILATFIFGQGDDYTIFMTEGASFEYAHRRKILASYKSSIIVSALIMFIGIGTLIVAKHPALHSLAEVTILGMFSVVLMAYTIPPYLFKLLVINPNGGYLKRPLRLSRLLAFCWCATVFLVQLAGVYVYGLFCFRKRKITHEQRLRFRRYVSRLFRYDMYHLPNVKFTVEACDHAPEILICNHQSMLDSAIFMALSPRYVLVSNDRVSSNPLIKQIYKWLGFISLSDDIDVCMPLIEQAIKDGDSVVIFPEGKRNDHSSILRFHKGPFHIAQRLGVGVQTVFIHGVNDVLPRNSLSLYAGEITVEFAQHYAPADMDMTTAQLTSRVYDYYVEHYSEIARRQETIEYLTPIILDRYRYKGAGVLRTVKRNLKRGTGNTYGELTLAEAMMNPEKTIVANLPDQEAAELLRYSAEGIAPNIQIP